MTRLRDFSQKLFTLCGISEFSKLSSMTKPLFAHLQNWTSKNLKTVVKIKNNNVHKAVEPWPTYIKDHFKLHYILIIMIKSKPL